MSGIVIGLDLGTSGVRAIALTANGEVLGQGSATLPPGRVNGLRYEQFPEDWWSACRIALLELGSFVQLTDACAIAVDATSGTILPVDKQLNPLAFARMYNDADTNDLMDSIRRLAPLESAAHGATSPAARAFQWAKLPSLHCILHQTDWINCRLGAESCLTDENNALKTGYDPIQRCWPSWLYEFGLNPKLLPKVVPVSTVIGHVNRKAASELGLRLGIPIAAGTTDGCATFLASGASKPGEGSTALGSTIVIKILSRKPIFAAEYGVYSHRLGDLWLAGGASNCGGQTLLKYFTPNQLSKLDPLININKPTGTDYYPLPSIGERFPIADEKLLPRLSPRPTSDADFLQGIYEAFARLELDGYQKLKSLGGPNLINVRHAGGGVLSAAWTHLRSKALKVPVLNAWSEQAAVGAARLAWRMLGHEIIF